jgi:hypothetical protein
MVIGVVEHSEKRSLRTCGELTGHIFKAGPSRVNQIASYAATMEHIKIYVGQRYDPVVLGTMERMQGISLLEPKAVAAPDGTMREV